MRKLIASMNITLDGSCDHEAGIADGELHQHYTDLLNNSGAILYGRTTYQLMEGYWPGLVKNPSGEKTMDDFAVAIDNIPKVLFSHTLKSVEWKTVRIAKQGLKEEILELKQQTGKDILAGSPSIIAAATRLNLVDEFILCLHPVIAKKNLPLFKDISNNIILKLLKTKTLKGGQIVLYYEKAKN